MWESTTTTVWNTNDDYENFRIKIRVDSNTAVASFSCYDKTVHVWPIDLVGESKTPEGALLMLAEQASRWGSSPAGPGEFNDYEKGKAFIAKAVNKFLNGIHIFYTKHYAED